VSEHEHAEAEVPVLVPTPAIGPAPRAVPARGLDPANMLGLQRSAGNRRVTRWLLARDDYAYDSEAAGKQADDTTTGLTRSQQANVQGSLLPYPQAIRGRLDPAKPDFAGAKALMGNFESTLRGLGTSHGRITSRARGLLESAQAPAGEVNAILDAKTMSVKDRSVAIEARFRNAEAELGRAQRYTQAEFDADIAKAKGAGATARDEATEAALRKRYAPLTDDQRAELQGRFLGPLAGLVTEVSRPTADYRAIRESVTALVSALGQFAGGASEKVAPDLQSGHQKLAEASRMIDAITADQAATVTTLRQLLGEIEGTLHRLLALPRRYDPEDPVPGATPPARLPSGHVPALPVVIEPE